VNGQYSFWSAQWLYEDPSEPDYDNTHPYVVALDAFASDPANLTIVGKELWAAQDELNVVKPNDFALPTR
jgi:hypothetical protein